MNKIVCQELKEQSVNLINFNIRTKYAQSISTILLYSLNNKKEKLIFSNLHYKMGFYIQYCQIGNNIYLFDADDDFICKVELQTSNIMQNFYIMITFTFP